MRVLRGEERERGPGCKRMVYELLCFARSYVILNPVSLKAVREQVRKAYYYRLNAKIMITNEEKKKTYYS